MPCDTIRRINLEEEIKAQREREEQLARLEQDLAAGIAQIVVMPDGTVQILGTIPAGMQDACVMARLQQRNSQEFQTACMNAGILDVNFVQAHADLHAQMGHNHGGGWHRH